MPDGLPITLEKSFVNEFGKTYGRVIMHAAQRALVMEWYGYTTKNQIEVVALWVESLMQQIPFDTILNDCTYIISVWDDSIEWFSQTWLLRMKRMGIMRFIHIAKPRSFGNRIGRDLSLKRHTHIEYLFFSTRQEITEWLNLHDSENKTSVQ